MPRKIDPRIQKVLKDYDMNAEDACWELKRKNKRTGYETSIWIMYHKALEEVAAKAGIQFKPPQVIEAVSKERIVALCVEGTDGDRTEWSIGEAAPVNLDAGGRQNPYPYAMAEKRAKDRVILKLVGLHGVVYSEEEAADFKEENNQDAFAKSRDIASQHGTGDAPPPRLEVYTKWNEVEQLYDKPVDYLEDLTGRFEESGDWFPPNEVKLEEVGRWAAETGNDEIRKRARQVYKFGRDAAANKKLSEAGELLDG